MDGKVKVKLGKVKLVHLPHTPWYFQTKLLAAKALVYPRHCLAYTPEEMLKHGLVPSTGRSYQVSNPADWVPKGFFSVSEGKNGTRESAWSGGAASKAMSTGTDQSLSLCNSFKQLGLKQVYLINTKTCFLYPSLKEKDVCSLLHVPWFKKEV